MISKLTKTLEKTRGNVFIYGPTGSGKSRAVLDLFKIQQANGELDAYFKLTMSPGVEDVDLITKFAPDESGKLVKRKGILRQVFEQAKPNPDAGGDVDITFESGPWRKLVLTYKRIIEDNLLVPVEQIEPAVVGKRIARSVIEHGGDIVGEVYPFKAMQIKEPNKPKILAYLDASGSMAYKNSDGYTAAANGAALLAALHTLGIHTDVVIHSDMAKFRGQDVNEYLITSASDFATGSMEFKPGSGEGTLPIVDGDYDMVIFISDGLWFDTTMMQGAAIAAMFRESGKPVITFNAGALDARLASIASGKWAAVNGMSMGELAGKLGRALRIVQEELSIS